MQRIILTILMAGPYQFQPGKKVTFYKSENLYYAACNEMDFGLVKEITEGLVCKEELGEKFDGIIIDVKPEKYLMKVQVKKYTDI